MSTFREKARSAMQYCLKIFSRVFFTIKSAYSSKSLQKVTGTLKFWKICNSNVNRSHFPLNLVNFMNGSIELIK